MPTPRTLKNAPITEAIIDIRVALSSALDIETLHRLRLELQRSFPAVEEQRQLEGIVQVIEGRLTQSMSDQGIRGLVLRNEETHEAVQVRDTGFGFSKLRPYTTWEALIASARQFWPLYARIARVETAHRLAVRYINHFPIPRSTLLSGYLSAPPSLPQDIEPNNFTAALSQLMLHDDSTQIVSRVIQATETSEAGTSVIIDIDSFVTGEFPPGSDDFWTPFEKLRMMKNRIFFGSVTDRAVEEFDR